MGDFMKKISYWAIAFTYVGTVVGAGFASGQEIKNYFADFGVYGLLGLFLATILIAVLGEKIMLICNKNGIKTYDKLLSLLANKTTSKIFDFFITIFLIGTITTMCSGLGTLLKQVFGIPLWVGSLLLMISSIFVMKKGINEISKLNVLVVPILILITIIIAVTSFNGIENISFSTDTTFVKSAFFAVLYVAYNIVMSISILPALSVTTDRSSIKKGSALSGVIIGILALLIYLDLLSNYDIIQGIEIPMAVLSNKYIGFYIIIFVLEVFSTAVSALYGVYGRINKNDATLYLISGVSYVFSLLGFSNLITYLYGIMGVIGIIMIFVLLKGEGK